MKTNRSTTRSGINEVLHKCLCLLRIHTRRYIHGSNIVIEIQYVFSPPSLLLSLSCFCVLLSRIMRTQRHQQPILLRMDVPCLCYSTLLSIDKRKKPLPHAKVFLSISEQDALCMTQPSYWNRRGKNAKEIKRKQRKKEENEVETEKASFQLIISSALRLREKNRQSSKEEK